MSDILVVEQWEKGWRWEATYNSDDRLRSCSQTAFPKIPALPLTGCETLGKLQNPPGLCVFIHKMGSRASCHRVAMKTKWVSLYNLCKYLYIQFCSFRRHVTLALGLIFSFPFLLRISCYIWDILREMSKMCCINRKKIILNQSMLEGRKYFLGKLVYSHKKVYLSWIKIKLLICSRIRLWLNSISYMFFEGV